ncbi:2,3-bisphosphoglycerate-independent phosphoglycerate mutase [bacterium (Candidatus Torokbacteria) CG_4_10_14_0_2_um_filter_35_8]|nr:MAG: 2,3-bisphosphoglycerate-independent phosphoglycerate mutase [bacterium (Candidatus Torokbacteria) CG_4_10_14_0_2_um_filter_35_8]
MSKPIVLIILDGWGLAPPGQGNAVESAYTPNFDNLKENYPFISLQASGEAVGLFWGEPGNSEVGHMNLGGGRIIFQDVVKITNSIKDGSFFKNQAFLKVVEHVKKHNSSLHLMGLVSPGGVHSHQDHLYALLELAKRENVERVFVHAFLDGRDTAPKVALSYIEELEKRMEESGVGKIATLSGRYFAMDRDNNWWRVEKAYQAMVLGEGIFFQDSLSAIQDFYDRGIYDETIQPIVVTLKDKKLVAKISDNDGIIFFNFRSDRARQITKAFINPDFKEFDLLVRPKNIFFTAMTEYEKGLNCEVAFPEEEIKNSITEVVSLKGLKQFHIAETEKYAHVTYFFDCGNEEGFFEEVKVVIPSPDVATYDLKPEMSAFKVRDRLIQAIQEDKYAFVLVNFANPDMVGHTGNISAGIKACEAVDKCLGDVIKEVLAQNGVALITADHGNAEVMLDPQTLEMDKKHNTSPVPFILVGSDFKKQEPEKKEEGFIPPTLGFLSDVAPTVLNLMGIEKPAEMTGRSLMSYLVEKEGTSSPRTDRY